MQIVCKAVAAIGWKLANDPGRPQLESNLRINR
jgi:hypothetical protein